MTNEIPPDLTAELNAVLGRIAMFVSEVSGAEQILTIIQAVHDKPSGEAVVQVNIQVAKTKVAKLEPDPISDKPEDVADQALADALAAAKKLGGKKDAQDKAE